MAEILCLTHSEMTALWLRDITESAKPGVRFHDVATLAELHERISPDVDVVFLDVQQSAEHSAATVRAITSQYPRISVVIFAGGHEVEYAAQAVAAGAHALLSRTPHEAALRSVLTLAWPPATQSQPTPAVGRGGLTARELAILAGMSEGLSNAEIGARLFVSADTVKTQAKRLFLRLGVHDRAAAVATGIRRRLIA
jgi:hypothetical protein